MMTQLPFPVGVIHFVGIGGIGMSGIAEIMHSLGYKVRGSDQADNANVKRLRGMGIPIEIGHRAENLADAGVIVVSSAVKADNPEVVAARAKLMPVVRRAEMLGELMRLKWSIAIGGTHGKTTTTSMVAALLDAGGTRSDRRHRRHRQRLRHQRAARQGRLDGGGGRRIRRHLREAAGHRRRRHQHGPGASRPLRHGRGDEPGLRGFRQEHPVLRLRRALHRPSGGAGDDPAPLRPPHRHLRHEPAGRRARREHQLSAPAARPTTSSSPTASTTPAAPSPASSCRCSAGTTCRTRWPPSPSPTSWASTTTSCAAASPASPA